MLRQRVQELKAFSLCSINRRAYAIPLDVPQSKEPPGTDEEIERPADTNGPFAALAFKIMADPFVGKLAFFRVYPVR